MAMPQECFCFALCFVAPLCLQWPLAQLLPAAWPGGASHCSVYPSLMSMNQSLTLCSKLMYCTLPIIWGGAMTFSTLTHYRQTNF